MSKEKQIEEMSGFVGQAINHNCWLSDERMEEIDMKGVAEELYNAGYRKQSEGWWIQKGNCFMTYACSVCGSSVDYAYQKTSFCPKCGAKMKGGAE